MKYTPLFITLLFAASQSFAQTKEINFEKTSFAEIKAKAKKENKLIFVDAYTTWCGPCKWMAANVFTNDTVADYFNAKFINAKIDMEKGEGPELAKQYTVQCYPNLLFIDGDGKLVHRSAGAHEAQKFISIAETAYLPEKRFSYYTEKYNSKKYEPAFLIDYMNLMDASCLASDEVLTEYFKTQKEADLTNRVNWNAIRDFSNDYKSREFTYLLKNVDAYKKLYTADSVDNKIKSTLIMAGNRACFNRNSTEKDYTNYMQDIKSLNYPGVDEVIFNVDLAYSQKKGDWAKYSKLFSESGEKFLTDPIEINNVSYTLYENSDDKKALEKAESLMKKAVEQNQEWFMLDTYAAVLYKLKKKAEAQKMAEKAIDLAKQDGATESDYKGTLDLLEQIKKL